MAVDHPGVHVMDITRRHDNTTFGTAQPQRNLEESFEIDDLVCQFRAYEIEDVRVATCSGSD